VVDPPPPEFLKLNKTRWRASRYVGLWRNLRPNNIAFAPVPEAAAISCTKIVPTDFCMGFESFLYHNLPSMPRAVPQTSADLP
jgi:hypothetical protein